MSSRYSLGSPAAWLRNVLGGLLLLLLSLYLLLAAGLLGEGPGSILGDLVSDDETTIRFAGLRTDLFWNTKADSVIITGSDGLRIAVCGVAVDGGIAGYLLRGDVREVLVERLLIDLPGQPAFPDDEPASLVEILEGIDAGIAVSADRLRLSYGVIREEGTVLMDSMHLDASVVRAFGVAVDVRSAGIHIPDLGSITGRGLLRMDDRIVSTDGFSAAAPPGSLTVAGTLHGPDETLDARISGYGETAPFDLPANATVDIEGRVWGRLSRMNAELALSGGHVTYDDLEASFEADTLFTDLRTLTVRGLGVSSQDAELMLDGSVDLQTLEWTASVLMGAYGLNAERYLEGAATTDLTGTLSATLSGTGASAIGGTATVDLSRSRFDMVGISNLHLDASLHGRALSLRGSVAAGGGSLSFGGTAQLDHEWNPESWRATAEGEIRDFTFLREFTPEELPVVSYVRFSLSGSGTRSGMNAGGAVTVHGFRADGISAGMVSVRGDLNFVPGRGPQAYGLRLAFTGRGEVMGLIAGGASVDTARVQGSLNIAGLRRSAGMELSVDSIRFGREVLNAHAELELDGDFVRVAGLTLEGSGDRLYTAELTAQLGDTTFFRIRDLRASHSKLRLLTDGGLSGYFTDGLLRLDTLWVDPPVGRLAMSGLHSEDSTRLRAEIVNFDLTSFSTFSGLPASMSGVGSFDMAFSRDASDMRGSIIGTIANPAYGHFRMDSITVDVSAEGGVLTVNGIYAWQDGVRSGLQMRTRDILAHAEETEPADMVEWLELEVNNIGDWLFYALPIPVRTRGASVSARLEYEKHNGKDSFELHASARMDRLYITLLGVELPNIHFYLSYPDTSRAGYNSRVTLGSTSPETGDLTSVWRADIRSVMPFELGDYTMRFTMTDMKVAIPGIGAVICSGELLTRDHGLERRPLIAGKIRIHEGAVGIPQPTGAASGAGDSGELPFDLSIDVAGTGSLWFRTSFADIELALQLRIFTLERIPTVNGYVSAVRGRITLLQRDFRITEGVVNVIQGNPPAMQLNVEAQTTVRSAVSHQQYIITVLIHGDAENPQIVLTGIGPAGPVAQEDVLTLLAAGLTYSEMQQMNSAAIRSEVETVAQTMLGSLLARNIRHEIGLDTFEISPELLADTTSLVLNMGKYVLPDLYVSYKDDVFSSDPGTVSAQYLFSRDLFVEGTSRTTVHGNLEPTIELHYTIRY